MPNRPLIKQTAVIPLYTGLQSEIVDKLVQPGTGVLELENMVANVTGEMSKRPGSANLIEPTTPTLPSGGTLPAAWQFTTRAAELVRLSQLGPTPVWPFSASRAAFLNPAGGTISSLYRGPIVTSYVDVVDQVSVASSARVPDYAFHSGGFGIEAHEQINAQTGQVTGIVELVVDQITKRPIYSKFIANRQRPRCVAIGSYLMVWSLNFDPNNIPGSVMVDVYGPTFTTGTPTTYTLTTSGAVGTASLIDVCQLDANTCRVAYTDVDNTIRAIDFNPVGPAFTIWQPTAPDTVTKAVFALAWMQDFGASGKSSLIAADPTNGVVVYWAFSAPSGGTGTAANVYVIDDSDLVGTVGATDTTAGVYNVSGYTTSADTDGEFVVTYDVLALSDSAKATIYRGTKVGDTVTKGAPYWITASLASKYWKGSDTAVYCLVSYSNSATPQTPQNTYFAAMDGVSQPVPLATIMPQGAGGYTGRNSALPSVGDPANGIAVASLADLQYLVGTPTQLMGVRILSVTDLHVQDTTTSPPIEAFGYSLIPGGTMAAYDGRMTAEGVFCLRPEPPVLTPVNAPAGSGVTIPQTAGDTVSGAQFQPLVVSDGDFVIGSGALIHNSGDYVSVSGGDATYVFITGFVSGGFGGDRPIDARVLNDAFVGGTLTVAGSGVSGNNGSHIITAVRRQTSGALSYYEVVVPATTQSNASMGSGTTGTIAGVTSALGAIMLSAPGISNVSGDTTLSSQMLMLNIGGFNVPLELVSGGTAFSTVTAPSGATYYKFQTTNTSLGAFAFPATMSTPTLELQLADPTQVNTWVLSGASFAQTDVGKRLTVTGAANPCNSTSVTIKQVLDSATVVTDAPSAALRNEALGSSGTAYTLSAVTALPTGSHSYCAIYTSVDASGRKLRSAPSLPATVTTTTDFPGVSASVNQLAFTGRQCNVELYRAQTGKGGQYNLVGATANTPTAPAVFVDVLGDDVIAKQEELFTDGGILGGTPIPGVRLVAAFQKRVVVVSPEAPQSLFYSNPDNQGSGGSGDGLLFDTTNFSLDVIDDHGPITAIQAMDSALIVFKKDAVYAVTGTGPDGKGEGGGYQAQLIAAGVGCSNPRSVVLQVGSGSQFDGVWFQSNSERAGIHTVTRGLTVEYTGAGVRRYSDETIISALVFPAQSQIRWYTASGRTLVWSWISKIWSTFTGQPCASAVMFEGLPTYAPTGALSQYVLQESAVDFQEGIATSYVPYTAKVASPWLSLPGLKGFERVYRIQGVGRTIGAHVLTVNLYADYDDTKLVGTLTKTFDGTSTSWDWEVRPKVQKLDALKIEIIGSDLPGATFGSAGFACTAVALVYGTKKGLNKLPDSARMANS